MLYVLVSIHGIVRVLPYIRYLVYPHTIYPRSIRKRIFPAYLLREQLRLHFRYNLQSFILKLKLLLVSGECFNQVTLLEHHEMKFI